MLRTFFRSIVKKHLKPKGRIDFLSCKFTKERCEGICRKALLENMEIDLKVNFAASESAFGVPKKEGGRANFLLESDNIDTIGLYFNEDIKKWMHTLGHDEAIGELLAHCIVGLLCCFCEILCEAAMEAGG